MITVFMRGEYRKTETTTYMLKPVATYESSASALITNRNNLFSKHDSTTTFFPAKPQTGYKNSSLMNSDEIL